MTYEEYLATQKALRLKHKREIKELLINKNGPCPHEKWHFDLASLLFPCIFLLPLAFILGMIAEHFGR